MAKTYSCNFQGCQLVFSRAFQLKKHKATHEDPDSVHHCRYCDFYTLTKKNLSVHEARHTGEKIHECPHTETVHGPSGEPVEKRCEYKTNDRSLLIKHRSKRHGYTPRPQRTPSQPLIFVPYAPPSPTATTPAPVVTDSGASSVSELDHAPTQNIPARPPIESTRSCAVGTNQNATGNDAPARLGIPSWTSQEGGSRVTGDVQQAVVGSPDATSSSSGSQVSSTASFARHGWPLWHADGQQGRAEWFDAMGTPTSSFGDAVSVASNESVSLGTHGQPVNTHASDITTATFDPIAAIPYAIDMPTRLWFPKDAQSLGTGEQDSFGIMERWYQYFWEGI